jgi:hypothetical protein
VQLGEVDPGQALDQFGQGRSRASLGDQLGLTARHHPGDDRCIDSAELGGEARDGRG